jgi:hypothetical protein
VLDTELERQPKELARILVHELFHFAWARLGNAARRSYEALILEELSRHARGELGWSSESRKRLLLRSDAPYAGSTRWREYVCESFCDTAAWMYSGLREHPEFTLARRHRQYRAFWFRTQFGGRIIAV